MKICYFQNYNTTQEEKIIFLFICVCVKVPLWCKVNDEYYIF